MMTKSSIELWQSICEHADSVRSKYAPDAVKADLAHLQSLEACKELLDLVETEPGLHAQLTIEWATDAATRQKFPSPFTHGVLIARDVDENLIFWRDARDPNSNLVCVTDAPKTAFVIADNVSNFLTDLLSQLNSAETDALRKRFWVRYLKENAWPDLVKTIEKDKVVNGSSDDLGLTHAESDRSISVDFAKAKTGAGVSLKYLGRHTKPLETGTESGFTLSLKPAEEIRKIELREKGIAASAVFIFAVMTVLFVQIGDAVPTALGKALVFLLGVCILFLAGWSWRVETREDKLAAEAAQAVPV